MKKSISIAIAVLVIGTILVTLLRNKQKLNEKKTIIDRSDIPVSVKLASVDYKEIKGEVIVPATLSAYEEANISAISSGNILFLNVDLGSVVKKGQVIGKIDVRETEIKLASAELSAEKLKRDYERDQALVAGNAKSANAVKDSKYALESKLLEVAQYKKLVKDAEIIAPISGIITDKKKVTGEYATLGSAVAVVVDNHQVKAKVYVPETEVYKIKIGQQVGVKAEVFADRKFSGAVHYISPKGDENHNYLVEVWIANGTQQLKAGVYVLVSFHNTQGYRKTLQIPKVALVDGIKNPYVYVAQNGKAVERKITLGQEIGENIEVLGSLKQNERVVVSGQINVINGSNIKEIGK